MSRRPALGLAAVVVAAFAAYATLGAAVDAPRAFSDELLYVETATSIAEGDGLSVRGEPYEYGPLFPLAVAALVALTDDLEGTWAAVKILNALFFALAAIPLFLLARRLLDPWPAVAVAGLSVVIPSSMYVSVVMTESLAYLAAAWALLAIALAFERPSWVRQVAALAAVLLAVGVRTQFVAFLAAYLVGLVAVTLLVPGRLGRPAALARAYLPTIVALAGAVAAFVVAPIARGAPPALLGNYSSLWRSYEVGEVLRWLVYHVANLELYLAVVPVAVAPIVVVALFRRARTGNEPEAAFLSLFASVNAVFLVLVAAFNSTIWAGERLHDRPLFYVIPLWLIVLFVWLRDGLPRPAAALTVGAGLALVLPLTLPLPDYVWDEFGLQHNGAITALWVEIAQGLGSLGLGVLLALVLVPLLAVALLLVVPARLGLVLPALVLAVFAMASAAAWASAERTADGWADALPDGRVWVDQQAPGDGSVALVTAIGECSEPDATRGPYLTEIFNRRVGPVAHLGQEPDFLPAGDARVARDGTVLVDGSALRASWVVSPASLAVAGSTVAEGTTVPLVLTRVTGTVRLDGNAWRAELERRDCD